MPFQVCKQGVTS